MRVTFNYRYSPPSTQVKDLLMSNAIGDVLSVEFYTPATAKHMRVKGHHERCRTCPGKLASTFYGMPLLMRATAVLRV